MKVKGPGQRSFNYVGIQSPLYWPGLLFVEENGSQVKNSRRRLMAES